MTGLINSLMGMYTLPREKKPSLLIVENYYIPPIILNKKTIPAGGSDNERPKQVYVCVDGKQRLSSVKAFIKGMIPCNDHRGNKWWFCDNETGNRKKKYLPEAVQREFLSKEFTSFEYTGLSPEQEEDLFARVQMGMQLTIAEKMRASTGPWQELARVYVEDFPVICGLLKDRSRAKDFQLTLSCFSQIIEVQNPTAANKVPILKTTHTHLRKLLNNQGAVDDALKSHLASVWNTFQDLINLEPNVFTNAEKTLTGVQTFAPIEMVAVAVLISKYSEARNKKILLEDIKALRNELRDNFIDIRMNAQLWKFIWSFIDTLEQKRPVVKKENTSTTRRAKRPRTDFGGNSPRS
jgi:hypothetical protein